MFQFILGNLAIPGQNQKQVNHIYWVTWLLMQVLILYLIFLQFKVKVHISCHTVVPAGWPLAYEYSKKLSASIHTPGIALKLETHTNNYLLHLLMLSVSMEAVDMF